LTKLLLSRLSKFFSLKDKKLFFKFFFSFTIMGVIPIFILAFLTYGKVLGILNRHIISSNIDFMNQGRNNLDAYLKQLHGMQGQLSSNAIISTLYTSKPANRVDFLYSIKDIRDELNKYGASIIEITDVLGIYFPKNNVVVTNTGFYENSSFFKDFRKFQDMDYPACFDRLQQAKPRQYWKASVVYDEYNIPKRIITCVQSLPFYTSGRAFLITFIDEEKVWRMFGESNSEEWKNYQGIMDENGQLIASSEDLQIPEIINSLDSSLFPGNSGHLRISENNTGYIVTYTSSSENKWKYFSVIPESHIMEKISPVRYLYMAAIILAFCLALTLSWHLSKRNCKPIRDIVGVIESNMNKAGIQKSGEYKIIYNTLSDMFKASREMESRLASHIAIARMHFLLQLIKSMTNMEKIKESMDLYSIHMPYGCFLVAVMQIHSYGNETHGVTQSYNNFSRFAASSIAEKTLNKKFHSYAVEVDENRIALLINSDINGSENNVSVIENALKEVIELVDVNLKINAGIGIGREYTSLDMVCISYNEAITALDYISVRRNYQIMHYNQVQSCTNSIYYPIVKEQQLINHVKLGDYMSAETLLEEIYRTNFQEREIPVKLAHCLFSNLISTLLKILEELKLDFNEYFNEGIGLMPDLNNKGSVYEVFEYIKSNLKKLCTHITEKKASHNTYLRDSIIKHIESEYADRNLSLMSVADHFDLTTPYLSRFFKEQTGYNFNDYLNRCRMQRAKKLMQESDISISDISERIGYNSPGTFIRIFKRYDSITPGQYKESILEE